MLFRLHSQCDLNYIVLSESLITGGIAREQRQEKEGAERFVSQTLWTTGLELSLCQADANENVQRPIRTRVEGGPVTSMPSDSKANQSSTS
jgi:hypothetical protein